MSPRITEFELKILSRIWACDNNATIGEILEEWAEQPAPGYTTVLKTLQIMRQKALVTFCKDGRAYRYAATRSNDEVSLAETEQVLRRTHPGDRLRFIHGFIDRQELTARDIDELIELLDQKKKKEKK